MNFSKRLSSFLNKHVRRSGNKVKTSDTGSTLRYNGELKNVPLPTEDVSLFNNDSSLVPLKEPTLINPKRTNDLAPKCPKCDGDLSSWDYKDGVLSNFWCNACESKELQQSFSNWTSEDPNIDKLIQESQLNIGYNMSYLEWIPYEQIQDMKEIGKGGHATVYSATWVDGPRGQWSEEKKTWDRCGERKVAVKIFNNSTNINPQFLDELKLHSRYFRDSYILQYYGISRQPSTGDFTLILELANMGNLRSYLQSNPGISWTQKLDILESLVIGLSQLHNNANLIHKDLHPGNVLLSNLGFLDSEPIIVTSLSDFGLTKPANLTPDSSSFTSMLYGVMPYVAPEVLQDHPFSKASDIFSLAMIMWELSSGKPPFYDRPHDRDLVLDICRGIRPDIVPGTPKCYVELMKSCWKSIESERPTTQIVAHTLFTWIRELNNTKSGEFYSQFKEADEKRQIENSIQKATLHPQAIYTSRSLNSYNKYTI